VLFLDPWLERWEEEGLLDSGDEGKSSFKPLSTTKMDFSGFMR